MKPSHPPEGQAKFSGNLRHYHRSGAKTQRSWDDWVEGTSVKPKGTRNWLKITGITVGLLALTGIIAGLVIELS
jgi:hypothetical protein